MTVTADQQAARLGIDRRSYNVAQDLQATTGAITDALRNVPSVQVDVQGNVSLRGDSNVTILIDGKPSALFQGEGRAAALEAISASQIERVEVMTNPSAAFSPDGSAGIINLVTRSTFRAGYSGSLRLNAGTGDRHNGSLNGSYQDGKLTASANVSARQDTVVVTLDTERNRRQAPGAQSTQSREHAEIGGALNRLRTGRVGIDYDLDTETRLGSELNFTRARSHYLSLIHQEQDDASGALVRALDRANDLNSAFDSATGRVNFRRKFSGDQHELTGSLSREATDQGWDRRVLSTSLTPLRPAELEFQDYEAQLRKTTVRLDYNRPLPDNARLKLGYALDDDANTYETIGLRGPANGAQTGDPATTYDFDYQQSVHAAYLTYQRPFGDLTVLPGLRVEAVDAKVGSRAGAVGGADYLRLYPSLHLTYRVSDIHQLTASYTKRVTRPRPEDLNPFRIYQDPLNFRQGNPQLLPQQTGSYELGYQYRKTGTFYLATLYYRHSTGGITDVVRDLGGAFLTTRENLRESRSGGLELVANGRLSKTLTYNVSGTVAWNEIDASTLGFTDKRSAFVPSGRANLNWQATPNDFFQLNGFLIGRTLTAQGHVEPFGMLNLGYRRKLTDKLTLMVQGQDLLKGARQQTVYDSPLLTGFSKQKIDQRAVFIGFTWTFGGGRQQPPQRDPGFDFGGGAPAGPQ